MIAKKAIVGVADHAGWAVVVTVAGGELLDRRRIELLEEGLPRLPHHHEAQKLPMPEAVALVERVRSSANACATRCLETLAADVSIPIAGIAIRECPPLPDTVAERITDYRAQNVADTVMFREALAGAAEAWGWSVHWYDAKSVFAAAAAATGQSSIDRDLQDVGREIGPPWQKDHRTAMAAAIAVSVRTPAKKRAKGRVEVT